MKDGVLMKLHILLSCDSIMCNSLCHIITLEITPFFRHYDRVIALYLSQSAILLIGHLKRMQLAQDLFLL